MMMCDIHYATALNCSFRSHNSDQFCKSVASPACRVRGA